MCDPEEENGFIPVRHKRKKKISLRHQEKNKFKYSSTCHPINVNKIDKTEIKKNKKSIRNSDFFIEFAEKMITVGENWRTVTWNDELEDMLEMLNLDEEIDLICYGLGSFSSCAVARHQLAFLLALRDLLHITEVSLYDPIFSSEECVCLKELGLNVLKMNEKAKRTIQRKTIFFMPHCDLPLYNNLLWSNWNIKSIFNLVIIGNSFSGYERLTNPYLEKNGRYVKSAIRFVSEMKLSKYLFHDIFNDMSIHYFKFESICQVPTRFWMKTGPPVYESDDSINYS